MNSYDIYSDIAKRTGGDIYVGVVGPVRTGKSTFIRNVLNTLVIPNITAVNTKERAIDEIPQSGDGKSIMTTQPQFIPNEAINITLNKNINMKIRLIDCVGYLVDGAIGHEENKKPRLVKTPWHDGEIPFTQAAEIGTKKVITNHSTIGILLTTDGSITDIERSNYVAAEEKVYEELIKCGKPFAIVINSKQPFSEECKKLKSSLSKKYKTNVLAMDVAKITEEDISQIFATVLNEFAVAMVDVKMPRWLSALPYENKYIQEIVNSIMEAVGENKKIGDFENEISLFENNDNFKPITNVSIVMGEGKVDISIEPNEGLFYKVLSEECGYEISGEYHLISYVKQLTEAKVQYDKFKHALKQVDETGYGVVYPTIEDMSLEEPEIAKQGGRFGVKLRASAPSLHLMQVDINTEINPVVGSEQQSEDLVKYLLSGFDNDPKSIWETKMFGKNLSSLVNEGLQNKLIAMPVEVQKKMRKTLGRIVNEGKGGVICILL